MKCFTSVSLNAPARTLAVKVAAAAVVALATLPGLHAQQLLLAATDVPTAGTFSSSVQPATVLPDAPSAVADAGGVVAAPVVATSPLLTGSYANDTFAVADTAGSQVAPRYDKTIYPYQTAQSITAHDKVVIGLRDLYSFANLAGIVLSAGYTHLTNGQPNYGTNSKAFGQRVGASAIRTTSQGVFTDTIFHPLFHTDPRYYVDGNRHSLLHRTTYAVTRVLVTRTNSGHSTLNAPLLLGYGATSAMTPLYYPQINRNAKDVLSGYGGSLGGAAIGFVFSEFYADLLHAVHLGKRP